MKTMMLMLGVLVSTAAFAAPGGGRGGQEQGFGRDGRSEFSQGQGSRRDDDRRDDDRRGGRGRRELRRDDDRRMNREHHACAPAPRFSRQFGRHGRHGR